MSTRLVKHQKLTKRQIKEDPLVTAAFRGAALWERHGTRILVGLGALVLAVLLAIFVSRTRAQSEERASGDLFRARMSLAQHDYPTAIQMLREIVDNAPGTRAARDAMGFLGDAYSSQGKPADAVSWYRRYLGKAGRDPIVKAAALNGLAVSLEDRGDFQQAAENYGALAKLAEWDSERARALLSQARCYGRAGQNQKAIEIYREIGQLPNVDVQSRNSAEFGLGEMQATTPR